jgi:SRSO17 transposase
LEEYICHFDDLFTKLNQREGLRRYLEGLLLPTERNKTLTGLANTEPVVGAQQAVAQKLQWFLSESSWDPAQVNQRRLERLMSGSATAPHSGGALVIDETGDRKWGDKTAHVGRQYLGSIGKVENGVVSVHSLWADEGRYYPVEVEPYTPARWFAKGKSDPAFRTKPEIALEQVQRVLEAGVPFRAVVADSFYGENLGFVEGLEQLELGYVLALNPSHAWWHPEGEIGSVEEVAWSEPWHPDAPGAWQKIIRRFRDGHQEAWWVLEGRAGPYGPAHTQRLVIVTTDPASLPELNTWYLLTNLPAPQQVQTRNRSLPSASLVEVVRLYGLRVWVEQSYKQVKNSLGWAQYQVRSDLAIRRHWQLVCCAFSFCWWAADWHVGLELDQAGQPVQPDFSDEAQGQKKRRFRSSSPSADLAHGPAAGAGMAGAVDYAATLLASLVRQAPTSPVAGTA